MNRTTDLTQIPGIGAKAVHYADNDGQLPPDKQNWGDWKD